MTALAKVRVVQLELHTLEECATPLPVRELLTSHLPIADGGQHGLLLLMKLDTCLECSTVSKKGKERQEGLWITGDQK